MSCMYMCTPARRRLHWRGNEISSSCSSQDRDINWIGRSGRRSHEGRGRIDIIVGRQTRVRIVQFNITGRIILYFYGGGFLIVSGSQSGRVTS